MSDVQASRVFAGGDPTQRGAGVDAENEVDFRMGLQVLLRTGERRFGGAVGVNMEESGCRNLRLDHFLEGDHLSLRLGDVGDIQQ